MVAEIDGAVRTSLTDFFRSARNTRWQGREREAVSLYAFGFLLKHCAPGRLLHDPAQIGIEVAVPGVSSTNLKKQVCKDLVIWPAPGMTCWDDRRAPTKVPLAILEWKVTPQAAAEHSKYDLDWLARFSSEHRDVTGFAVSLVLGGDGHLGVQRVRRGRVQAGWLRLEGGSSIGDDLPGRWESGS